MANIATGAFTGLANVGQSLGAVKQLYANKFLGTPDGNHFEVSQDPITNRANAFTVKAPKSASNAAWEAFFSALRVLQDTDGVITSLRGMPEPLLLPAIQKIVYAGVTASDQFPPDKPSGWALNQQPHGEVWIGHEPSVKQAGDAGTNFQIANGDTVSQISIRAGIPFDGIAYTTPPTVFDQTNLFALNTGTPGESPLESSSFNAYAAGKILGGTPMTIALLANGGTWNDWKNHQPAGAPVLKDYFVFGAGDSLVDITGGLPDWETSKLYRVGDTVNNGTNTYVCTVQGTSAGSGGPTGTGTGIVDNGATWDFFRATLIGSVPGGSIRIEDNVFRFRSMGHWYILRVKGTNEVEYPGSIMYNGAKDAIEWGLDSHHPVYDTQNLRNFDTRKISFWNFPNGAFGGVVFVNWFIPRQAIEQGDDNAGPLVNEDTGLDDAGGVPSTFVTMYRGPAGAWIDQVSYEVLVKDATGRTYRRMNEV